MNTCRASDLGATEETTKCRECNHLSYVPVGISPSGGSEIPEQRKCIDGPKPPTQPPPAHLNHGPDLRGPVTSGLGTLLRGTAADRRAVTLPSRLSRAPLRANLSQGANGGGMSKNARGERKGAGIGGHRLNPSEVVGLDRGCPPSGAFSKNNSQKYDTLNTIGHSVFQGAGSGQRH